MQQSMLMSSSLYLTVGLGKLVFIRIWASKGAVGPLSWSVWEQKDAKKCGKLSSTCSGPTFIVQGSRQAKVQFWEGVKSSTLYRFAVCSCQAWRAQKVVLATVLEDFVSELRALSMLVGCFVFSQFQGRWCFSFVNVSSGSGL